MQTLLIALISIYFLVGLAYAIYVLFYGYDRWYWFPINLIGGPVVIFYLVFLRKEAVRR